jgi:hypothetical protein
VVCGLCRGARRLRLFNNIPRVIDAERFRTLLGDGGEAG